MEEVKISVITVCYNAVDTLEKTIQSVLEQTYHNIEYIIIDGGSTMVRWKSSIAMLTTLLTG